MKTGFVRPAALIAALLLLAGAGLYWAEGHQDAIRLWLEQARGMPWALPAVCGLYLAAGAVFFPVTVLNLGMAMVFGPLWGVIYGLAGSLLSAGVFFGLGRWARRRHFHWLLDHPKVRRIDEGLQQGGVVGVALLRLVPLGPYTLFNLASSITSIRFADYMAGTFLALLPGAVARGMVGGSLMDLFLERKAEDMAWLGAGLALWLAVMAASHLILKKYRRA